MEVKRNILLLFMVLIFSSCENWLELMPPDGLVKDEYWKTKEDLEATLMGAYQGFARLDERLFIFGEARADMVIKDVNTPGHIQNLMEGNIYPDNPYNNWSGFYTIINYCNSVLKYAPIIENEDATFNEYQRKGYEAEAIFLRSLAYFYLVRIYRSVPLMLVPAESDEVDFYLPVSDEATILDKIKEDLRKARLSVTANYPSHEENKGRATKEAINALLADISLWNFEYEACIEYVEQIEAEGLVPVPSTIWYSIFYPGNSLESIFEFQFDGSLGQNNSTYDWTFFQRRFLASEKAMSRFDTEEESSASEEYIRGPGSLRASDKKIWKYSGSSGDSRSLRPNSERNNCNWIVYRMSDLVLMKAEALSQLGKYDEALTIVNNLRLRRQVDAVSAAFNATAFEDLIMEERMLELAFEGKRWFDLLRLGRRNNYQRKTDFINIVIENVPSTQKLVLASKLTNSWGWYLPIYSEELERNSNLEQNPYYADYSTDK